MIFIEKYKKFNFNCFQIGIFLLPSAPFIASIFLLTSISKSFLYKRKEIIKDKKDILFILAFCLMIIISFIHFFNFEDINFIIKMWNSKLEIEENFIVDRFSYSSFIGLSNWLPLFLCFFGFQPYLRSHNQRKIIIKLLIAGSIPVLISGFGQLFFGWHKQLDILNGLIIWFQKPSNTFSGLFNNQNYAGCWLNIIWPLSIAVFYEHTRNIFQRGTSLILLISIFLASFLTFSRNAWGGLLISIPLVIGPIALYWMVLFLIILILIILLKSFNILPENISNLLSSIYPARFNIFEMFIEQFSSSSYPNPANSRNTIFFIALKYIMSKPFIGWGAASFPIYYGFKTSIYISHAHNLFIDNAFNYGLLVTFLIFSNIFLICLSSFKKIFLKTSQDLKNNYFERAWWTSFFVLLCSQMFDVQYYDLRISIAFWLMIAGLKCVIFENSGNISHTK